MYAICDGDLLYCLLAPQGFDSHLGHEFLVVSLSHDGSAVFLAVFGKGPSHFVYFWNRVQILRFILTRPVFLHPFRVFVF